MWIKMRTGIGDDPDVVKMAMILQCEQDLVVGKLHRFWSWIDSATADGTVDAISGEWIDNYVRMGGFSSALSQVGWLEICDEGIRIPKFEEHMSDTAKKRALTRNRVEKKRCNADSVTESCNAPSVTKALPEKSKIREDINNPPIIPPRGSVPKKSKFDPSDDSHIPEPLKVPRFMKSWDEWIEYRREKKKALTPSTTRKQLQQLAGYGCDGAIQSIEDSIRNGYTGLFEPKSRGSPGKPRTNGQPATNYSEGGLVFDG